MQVTAIDRIRRVADIAVIALFLGTLTVVLGVSWLGPHVEVDADEKRELAAMPAIRPLGRFPTDFERYFNDHFGYREPLVRFHNHAKVRWLGVSPSSSVTLGKDDWLFYSAHRTLDYYRATDPLDEPELHRWGHSLIAKQDWLERRNVAYVFVVAPNKHSIYPEYLPDTIQRVSERSRLDQLLEHLGTAASPGVVDPRAALLDAKGAGRVYFSTDTHWNDRGAAVAYREIVRELDRIAPALATRRPVEVAVRPATVSGGDLAAMLKLSAEFAEQAPSVSVEPAPRAHVTSAAEHRRVYEIPGSSLPSAVMFHDSFGYALMAYLAEHFSRTVFIPGKFDAAVIPRERPDVVIEEMCERFLMEPAPIVDLPLAPPAVQAAEAGTTKHIEELATRATR